MVSCFPIDDNDFTEELIDSVEQQGDGSYSITCKGWSLWCGKDCPKEPKPGYVARKYGRGAIRGLFINGVMIWYRTEAEYKEYREIEMYGVKAADWLARWDAGDTVWSISMSGLGPGYEQCIHITAAEIIRWLINENADASLWDDMEITKPLFDRMEKALFDVEAVKKLGLSGMQWSAACNLASMIYRAGPRAVMTDDRVRNRHIQVCRIFPS